MATTATTTTSASADTVPATTEPPKAKRQLTIKDHLQSPSLMAEIAKALPRHMKAERMARIAMTALTRIPDLQKCTQETFFRCLLDLSQLGLEPDGRHAHLIPFRNNKAGTYECTLIVDYKGLVALAYRSGVVKGIHADVVHEGDVFVYNLGTIETHVPWAFRRDPSRPESKGAIIAAYCIVDLGNGAKKCEVLTNDEVEGIRKRSKAGNSGPWMTDYSEMAKKTAFRRVSKWIPLSAEILDTMDRDDDRIIDAVDHRNVAMIDQRSRTEALEHKLSDIIGGSQDATEESQASDPQDA